MYKSIAVTIIVFISFLAQAQNWHKADSLHKALSRSNPDTVRINTFLNLAEFEILKPGELKLDLDSAAVYINQAVYLNRKINSPEAYGFITRMQGDLARERGQKAQGKALIEKAVQILSKGTDKYQVGQAYFHLAEYYDAFNANEVIKKLQLISLGTEAFKQGGDIEQEAYGEQVLGELTNDPTISLQHLDVSLNLYQSIHYSQVQGVYDLIGNTYLYKTDFKQALFYYLKALNIAEAVGDTTMQLCEINNHIGITFYKTIDFNKSVQYYKAALKTAQAYNDVQTIYLLTLNICDCYNKLNQPKDLLNALQAVSAKYPVPRDGFQIDYRFTGAYLQAYTMLKQFSLAKPYADHLLSIVNNSNKLFKTDLSDIYVLLIKYFIASKQYSLAHTYLIKNEALIQQLGISTNLMVNNRMWFNLDTTQHNYKDAVYHLLKFEKLYVSNYNATRNKQFKQLEVQFDTKRKEDKIRLLNAKDAFDQANLKQAKVLKDVTIGGIILVGIIAGLLYRQNRLKQKNNELITHKNEAISHKNELLQSLVTEKEWLLKEVHHRVKNNLHTVICLLESQAAYLEDDALKAIEKSQHRIYTMSLIHQKLYQSDDVKTIDMAIYIPELVQYLEDSFDVSGRIHFSLNIEPINLNPSQAIPLALLINEALTNSIKYAFPDNRKGEILISLTDDEVHYKLEIADNGIGLPEKERKETNSLGLDLMKGLSKEIMGSIHIENSNGVKITVVFDHDILNDMDASEVDYFTSRAGEIDL